jgi:putative membrane protein
MSELKKQRVFQSEPQFTENEQTTESLNTQKLFEETQTFIPQAIEEESELDDLDIETPLVKKKTHWSIKTLIGGFLGLTMEGNGIGQAKPFCETLAKKGLTTHTAEFSRWQNSIESHHNNAEVFEMYDSMVVVEQDKRAKALISKHAGESALMVALSPLAVVDMLLVAWRNIRLIEQVSQVYGVELGYWGRLRLFKMVLQNMAFAGATEMVTDVGVDMLSTGLAGKLSTRAAQGLGIGLLTARFGLRTMNLMRPLPWQAGEAPKLSDMRKTIVAQLVSKLNS